MLFFIYDIVPWVEDVAPAVTKQLFASHGVSCALEYGCAVMQPLAEVIHHSSFILSSHRRLVLSGVGRSTWAGTDEMLLLGLYFPGEIFEVMLLALSASHM